MKTGHADFDPATYIETAWKLAPLEIKPPRQYVKYVLFLFRDLHSSVTAAYRVEVKFSVSVLIRARNVD
jgi:hypothetical protein